MTGTAQQNQGIWGDPVLRRLLVSDALAFLGVWMTSLVVLTGVYETTHSSLAQGVAIASQFGPALLVMPFAGYLLDRFNPVRIMMLTRAFCGAIALFVFAAGAQIPVATVLALNVVFGTLFGLSVSATGVLLPLAMAGKNLSRGNIILRLVPNAMMIVGGLFLVADGAAFGLYGELLFAGLVFFASVALLAPAFMQRSFDRTALQDDADISHTFLEGLRYLMRDRTLLMRFLVRMGIFVCSGAVIVMAVLGETEFAHVVNAVGLFFAARGLGMIVGSLGVLPFVSRGTRSEITVLVAGLVLFAVALVAATWSVQLGLLAVAALLAVAFAGEGIAKPVSLTLLQRRTKSAYLGRIMALEQGLSAAIQTGLTMLIALILIDPSLEGLMLVAAGLGLLALIVAVMAATANRRTAARSAAVPRPV